MTNENFRRMLDLIEKYPDWIENIVHRLRVLKRKGYTGTYHERVLLALEKRRRAKKN